jgi:ketosteroid isomerase-like protein
MAGRASGGTSSGGSHRSWTRSPRAPGRSTATTEDHVFVAGHCNATSKSGSDVHARFVHLWTVRDGKLAHLVQTADSHVLQEALAS